MFFPKRPTASSALSPSLSHPTDSRSLTFPEIHGLEDVGGCDAVALSCLQKLRDLLHLLEGHGRCLDFGHGCLSPRVEAVDEPAQHLQAGTGFRCVARSPLPQLAPRLLTVPSLSHCWKPSLPGAGCATALPPSLPHCARIQRTSTCSSSGSYCRSIFCCTSRLSPYDGPRFAMLTAGGSAGMGPHQCLWWHWSTQHGTEGALRTQRGRAPSCLDVRHRALSPMPGAAQALPSSCPAGWEQALGLCPPKGNHPQAGWAALQPLCARLDSTRSIPIPQLEHPHPGSSPDLAGTGGPVRACLQISPVCSGPEPDPGLARERGARADGGSDPTPAGQPDPTPGQVLKWCHPCWR